MGVLAGLPAEVGTSRFYIFVRFLPHYHPDDVYLFVTWRLWGTLPARAAVLAYPTAGHAFVAQDHALDRQDPRIGDLVARAILMGEAWRHFYELCDWVVMPNHVHMLVFSRVALAVLMT
ncbi:MAG: hypothetical protein M1541_04585 [Acidobacteria bacterium]|nr:hypothetical protein [Acidobacteriota bacterium]